jgi:hypothetical protein
MPIGLYEQVMPFDLHPTYLLKALVTGDVERRGSSACWSSTRRTSRSARSCARQERIRAAAARAADDDREGRLMLRKLLDRVEPEFHKGGAGAILSALRSGRYVPLHAGQCHDRARRISATAIDMKRIMSLVIVSLIGTIAMALYNTGSAGAPGDRGGRAAARHLADRR